MSNDEVSVRLPNNFERYGASSEYLHALMKLQEGVCAVCQEKKTLYIDHDHETGQVRGWLCSKCNTALGFLNDDVKRLQRAVDYLLSTQERQQAAESIIEHEQIVILPPKQKNYNTFVQAPFLKTLRQQAGYSVNQLAEKTQVSYRTIYRMENAERVARVAAQAVLNGINDILGTSYQLDNISTPAS